ncbi:hypothetical protein GJ744_006766 [Endocarpon pusillum]|uniref:Uncharacterized protein n=1 Tax=Endocarpon pusillum TaxID=364733 RepID=A0A8H7A7Z3_9EURO|nr:hypothetical protein GJ744_006766 [Endocarpon pusillum]
MPISLPTDPSLGQDPIKQVKRIFAALPHEADESGSSASATLDGEQKINRTEAPAEVPFAHSPARSRRQRGASSISVQANRRGRPSTAQRTRPTKASSSILTQSTETRKPSTGPRRSTRLADVRLKELDAVAPMDASKATRKMTLKTVQRKTPKELEKLGCFSPTARRRGRPRKATTPAA